MSIYDTNPYDIGEYYPNLGIIISNEGRFISTSAVNKIESNLREEINKEDLSSTLKGISDVQEESSKFTSKVAQDKPRESNVNIGFLTPEIEKISAVKGRGQPQSDFAQTPKGGGKKIKVIPKNSFRVKSRFG
jgi:hypothetical protein